MVDMILWVMLPLLAFAIIMLFLSWAGSAIARRRIARLLQPDEIVLRKAQTTGGRVSPRFLLAFLLSMSPWEGTLYVTNRRIIWRRYLFAYRGPSLVEIPLESVDECRVQRVGPFGSFQLKAGSELLIFHLYRHYLRPTRVVNRGFAEDMARAINEARAGVATS